MFLGWTSRTDLYYKGGLVGWLTLYGPSSPPVAAQGNPAGELQPRLPLVMKPTHIHHQLEISFSPFSLGVLLRLVREVFQWEEQWLFLRDHSSPALYVVHAVLFPPPVAFRCRFCCSYSTGLETEGSLLEVVPLVGKGLDVIVGFPLPQSSIPACSLFLELKCKSKHDGFCVPSLDETYLWRMTLCSIPAGSAPPASLALSLALNDGQGAGS